MSATRVRPVDDGMNSQNTIMFPRGWQRNVNLGDDVLDLLAGAIRDFGRVRSGRQRRVFAMGGNERHCTIHGAWQDARNLD